MAARCPDAFLLVDETYRKAAYSNDPRSHRGCYPRLAGHSLWFAIEMPRRAGPAHRLGDRARQNVARADGARQVQHSNRQFDHRRNAWVACPAPGGADHRRSPKTPRRRWRAPRRGLNRMPRWSSGYSPTPVGSVAYACGGTVRPGRGVRFMRHSPPRRPCRQRQMVRRRAACVSPRLRPAADCRTRACARGADHRLATDEAKGGLKQQQEKRPDGHISFQQVDVFTDKPLKGNPLAVVVAADGLSERR